MLRGTQSFKRLISTLNLKRLPSLFGQASISFCMSGFGITRAPPLLTTLNTSLNMSNYTFHHLLQSHQKTAWRPLATPAWLLSTWAGHLDTGEVAAAAVRQQLAGNVEAPVAKLPPARYPQVEHLSTELDPHRLPVDVNLLVLLAQQHLPLRLLIVHLPVGEAEKVGAVLVKVVERC